MKANKKMILQVLFYGGIWGLIEASFGFLLHLVPTAPTGSILFPIAFLLMMSAYKKTNDKNVVILVPVVAALIKLTNVILLLTLIPNYSQIMLVKTINPAVAILIEGLVIAFVINMTFAKAKKLNFFHILGTTYTWNSIFTFYVYSLATSGIIQTKRFVNGFSMIDEILIPGFFGAIIASVVIFIARKVINNFELKTIKPSYALGSFAGALLMNGLVFFI